MLRPVLRSAASLPAAVLAVFVLGGLAGPAAHRAGHAAAWAVERAEHLAAHHGGDAGDHADAPCPPATDDLACALCAGLSLATPGARASVVPAGGTGLAVPDALGSAPCPDVAAVQPRGPPVS